MAMETRVVELEAELRGLKRTVAALAENILREMAARGAFLVVKAPAEEVAAIVAESRALAESKAAVDVVMEEDEADATMATAASEVTTERAAVDLERRGDEQSSAAAVEEDEAPTGAAAVVSEDDEDDEASKRVDVGTSQESSDSSSAGSEAGDEAPLSLSAFDDVVGCASTPQTPPPPLVLSCIPSRPPVIIPTKTTTASEASSAPTEQQKSKSKTKDKSASKSKSKSKSKTTESTPLPQVAIPRPSQVAPRSLPPVMPLSPPALRAPVLVPLRLHNSLPKTPQPVQVPAPVRAPVIVPPTAPPVCAPVIVPPIVPPVRAPIVMQPLAPSHISAAVAARQPASTPAAESDSALPTDFEVQTKDSVAVAWEKWCCGEPARGVPPLRSISTKQVVVKAVSRRLSDLRCAMMPIEIMAQTNGMWREDFTPREAASVFAELENHVPIAMATTGADGRKRKKEVAWSTALNNMRKKRKQQQDEVVDEALI